MSKEPPRYCRHKSSDRGYSRFGTGSKPTYFPGPFNSDQSLAAYHVALAEYLAGGRPSRSRAERLTVGQLLADWFREAERRYVKFGRTTDELGCQKSALRFVRELYADLPADEFGPVQLAAVRHKMVTAGWVRGSINQHVCRIRAVFRWAVSRGVLSESVWRTLTSLTGLRAGRGEARESVPRKPPTWRQLLAVLRRCPPDVGAMVRLQYLTGMRPGEVCCLRPVDVDRTGDLWLYRVRPEYAKTGKEVYWLGPRARRVLAPWLLRRGNPQGDVFSHSCNAYGGYVRRCCDAAGCGRFSPHCLRHGVAARTVNLFGSEGARQRLNHSDVKMTARYSGTADALAKRIAKEIG